MKLVANRIRGGRSGESAVAAACFLAVFGTIVLFLLLVPASHSDRRSDTLRARSDLVTIFTSLSEFAIDHDGKYPDTLQALVTPDAEGHGYLQGFDGRIPRDPWQREYLYERATPEHPVPRVGSLGKDGEPGGEGDDADIDRDHLQDE